MFSVLAAYLEGISLREFQGYFKETASVRRVLRIAMSESMAGNMALTAATRHEQIALMGAR